MRTEVIQSGTKRPGMCRVFLWGRRRSSSLAATMRDRGLTCFASSAAVDFPDEEPGDRSFFQCEGGGFSLGDEEEENHEEDDGPQAGQEDREEDLQEKDHEEITSSRLIRCRLRTTTWTWGCSAAGSAHDWQS